MKRKKGKIITVVSTKGGIGKTISVLNFAAVYHTLGYKVLVIDADLHGGSIATYVDSQNDRTFFNLVEDFSFNRYKAIEDYVYTYNENIDVIAAPKDPRLANKIDSKYIPLILGNVIYRYDIILIDTTHILNQFNITAIDNSDTVLYMLTNDLFDLKNSRSFLSIIRDAGMDNVYTVLNESRDTEKNFFSMYDIRNIIRYNIDFTIPKSMHIKNIDGYLMEGKILFLNKKLISPNSKDYKKFEMMAKALIEDKEETK